MADAPLIRRLFDASRTQDGCISSRQLNEIGVSDDTIASLVRRGVLARAAYGAYVVGAPRLTDRQLLWTALLTAGPGAVVSHWSAASLFRCADAEPGVAWVTKAGRKGERKVHTLVPVYATGRPGVIRIIGRGRKPTATVVDGFPTDSAARTMVAIAGRGTPEAVTAAWKEADYRDRLRAHAFDSELGRGIAGTALIRKLLTTHPIVSDDETNVATKAEYLLLAAVLRRALPRPLTNAPLHLEGTTYFPDQFYPSVGLVVEADGGVHRRPSRRAADGVRDAHMRAFGLEVLRIPNDDIERDADAAAQLVEEAWTKRITAEQTLPGAIALPNRSR